MFDFKLPKEMAQQVVDAHGRVSDALAHEIRNDLGERMSDGIRRRAREQKDDDYRAAYLKRGDELQKIVEKQNEILTRIAEALERSESSFQVSSPRPTREQIRNEQS